jgi:ribonuclease T1
MAGRWWIILAALSIVALWWYVDTNPLDSVSVPADRSTITTARLPDEAQDTLRLIERGGPYPYRQDGGVFVNRERHLPDRRRGYWHEFTVPTPREDDRGPRRLVVGSDGEVYYTDDHYASFRLVIDAVIQR